MDDAARAARQMWTLFEPVHVVTYFAAEARSAFQDAGLRGFWRGYFAGRAAPLGPVGAAPVTASFFNFAPPMVARALPGEGEGEPAARLWHAATLLREHRGDGHFAALVAADIDGCEALVLRTGADLAREQLQPVRGWTDEEWEQAAARLIGRGWLAEDGR